METFVRVVETGSFARAADRLELSVSAVSRQLADLESHLGTRLLNRTTRRLSLTETGRVFHERCVQLLADLGEAEQQASAHAVEPRGTLRMTCSVTFAVRHVAPAIAEFCAKHPRVSFDLDLSDRYVDLVDEGIDLAIRIGEARGQSLIARRIGISMLVCCASPAYLRLRGTPASPADLPRHSCLTYAYGMRDLWRFTDVAGEVEEVRVSGSAHASNAEMLVALASAGLGICLEPDFVVAPYIRAGRLVPILANWQAPSVDVLAVYPSRRHLSAKVRGFVDFLSERFARRPEWRLDFEREQPKPRPPRAGRRGALDT